MKCCDITPGKMDRKITVERKTTAPDGVGGVAEAWEELGIYWAMVRALSGSERWTAMRVSPETKYRAVVNFASDVEGRPKVTVADRVLYNGRYYGIQSVIDIEERRKFVELILIEGEPS